MKSRQKLKQAMKIILSISSPVEFSEVLMDGVRDAVLLRWKVDIGGRPLFISAAITECGE